MGIQANPISAKTWEYDFAHEGGAIGTIELTRGPLDTGGTKAGYSGGVIPAGSLILSAIVRVLTNFTGNSANTDISVVVPGLDTATALDAVDPATLDADEVFYTAVADEEASLAVTTADENPQVVIATDTVTAGKLQVTVLYIEF